MKRKLLVFLVVLVLISSLSIFAEAQKKTIGFALWTMEYTFFQNLEKGVKDAAAELGYDYIMLDQNSDPAKMVQDIHSLVGQKVDGIVITPVDPGAIGPAVQNARDAGIPVVCADIGFSGPVNALLISNNYQGGQMAMEYIAKNAKGVSKKVGAARVKPQWNYARQRGQGFMDKAKELGWEVAAEIVVEIPSAEGGFDTMQQIISAAPDVEGVFASSGREAVGAANAARAAGKDIVVVGYNGDPEELQAIKDGVLAATVAQQPWLIGYESVMLLKEIMAGKKMEQEEVPVEVGFITTENVDEWEKKFKERRGQ